MPTEKLVTEALQGTLRILSGTVKSIWGRVVNDGLLAAGGQFERLNGQASLVRVRVGVPARNLPPRG